MPPAAASLDEAYEAIELWEWYSGKTLDPAQRLSVCVMMAQRDNGMWAARTTGREMPRQNGKGDELEVVELWGLVMRGEAIFHSAHELKTVSSAHQRMVGLLSHKDFKSKVKKILNGIGQQMIEMVNGGVVAYATRTNGGGRGLDDISRLIVDEAQHAQPEQLASSTPILLANPNPQINFAGTGAIEGVSDYWWTVRDRALSGDPGDFGYVGHTAEKVYLDDDGDIVQEPVDAEDRTLWAAANTALVAGRVGEDFFAEQLKTLGAELFAREHLGVWDAPPVKDKKSGPISADEWSLLVDARSYVTQGTARVSADFIDGWYVSAVAGERDDGLCHVGLVASNQVESVLVADVVEACNAWDVKRIILPKGAPGEVMAKAFEKAGLEIDYMPASEQALATTELIRSATGLAPSIRHHGEPSVVKAINIAETTESSNGGQTWKRRKAGDIAPLTAITMAFGRIGVGEDEDEEDTTTLIM